MAADDDSRSRHDDEQREKEKIRRQVKRLGLGNPVRVIALELLEQGGDSVGDIEPLLASLKGHPEYLFEGRTVALWALGRMALTPDQARSAVGPLCKVLLDRESATTACLAGCAGALIFLPIFLISALWLVEALSGVSGFTGLLLSSLSSIVMIAILFSPIFIFTANVRRSNELRTMAATTLGRLGCPDGIWALADACHHSDTDLSFAALTSLRQVLPVLSADDYGRLPARTVPNLCYLLDESPIYSESLSLSPVFNEPFNRSVLEAIEKIGDGRAVAPVERLAKSSQSLRAVAERILPILRERQRLEREAERLLRPSAAPGAPAEVLLRPTVPTETPEALLLRPSERES